MEHASPQQLQNVLVGKLEAIAELTELLVEEESPTSAGEGVAAVLALFERRLRTIGFVTRSIDVGLVAPVLDAVLEFGPGPTVLVLGHADTVWPSGTGVDWRFARANGRWSGPGVGDMKACLVLAAAALEALLEVAPPNAGSVRFLVIPDEEAGSAASRQTIEEAASTAAACLTLEAARPNGGLVTSRGAVGAMHLESFGVACHVTDPGPHQNALTPLVAVATALTELSHHGATANIGVLSGGSARQIVPESAEAWIDLRAVTTEAAEELTAAVSDCLAQACAVEGVEFVVTGGVTRPAFPRMPGTVELYERAAATALVLDTSLVEVAERGGSDASFAAALGVPTLDGLGPICHGSCSREEWIEEDSLAVYGAIFADLVQCVLAGALCASTKP
jgi:glutamate carboxypeptidase